MEKSSSPKRPFWLTRDKHEGALSKSVEVWLVKPSLTRFEDGDIMWLPPTLETEEEFNFGEWTIEQCKKEVYVYPETERECIRCD